MSNTWRTAQRKHTQSFHHDRHASSIIGCARRRKRAVQMGVHEQRVGLAFFRAVGDTHDQIAHTVVLLPYREAQYVEAMGSVTLLAKYLDLRRVVGASGMCAFEAAQDLFQPHFRVDMLLRSDNTEPDILGEVLHGQHRIGFAKVRVQGTIEGMRL